MARFGLVVTLVAGCYDPRPATNIACGPGGECPSGQLCNPEGRCTLDGTSAPDAAQSGDALIVDAAADARPDGPPPGTPAMFRSVVAADGTSASTTIMSPAGTQVGDLLLAHVVDDGPADPALIPTPTGWTRVVDKNAVQDQFIVAVFYRYAAATSESFTFTFTAATNAELNYIELMAFSGVHSTMPINASAANALNDTNQPTAPSVTTTKANTLLVTMYAMDLSVDTYQPVPGMTEIYDQATGQLQVAADVAVVAAAGATGTKVAQRSGTDIGPTINATVALSPP